MDGTVVVGAAIDMHVYTIASSNNHFDSKFAVLVQLQTDSD